jgi:hypothetical protein
VRCRPLHGRAGEALHFVSPRHTVRECHAAVCAEVLGLKLGSPHGGNAQVGGERRRVQESRPVTRKEPLDVVGALGRALE